MICPISVQMIMRRLYANGYEAYIVGGAVRDTLLEKIPHDYDITTDATPEEVMSIFSDFKVIDTGIKHGTVTVIILGQTIEVTTYRSESSYGDFRHPDSVTFEKTLDKDLSRRDFTINALARDDDNHIVDLFGGEEDLKNHLIRCVGNADERFKEDPLRMLRAIRFASQLDFTIESKTELAIFNNYKLLANISKERIREELNKLILGYHIQELFSKYEEVFIFLIPELNDLLLLQENPHQIHNSLDDHTVAVVRNIPKEAGYKLKIAALLHDIGKFNTSSYDESNKVYQFIDHADESEKIARKVLSDLKYSNEDSSYICELIKYHEYQLEPTKKCIRKLLSKLVYIKDLKDLVILKIANQKDHTDEFDGKKYENILAKYQEILDANEAFSLKDLAINGDDLIELGYQAKDIGLVLDYLLELVIENPELNVKETLIEKCKTRGVE